MEDPDLVVDLRELILTTVINYSIFWKQCELFLQEYIAVHKRRCDSTIYLICALSLCHIINTCPLK